MITHNLTQGSSTWHEFRADHFGASEAAAALGISPYISRTELLELKSRGIEKDHSEFTKAIFQKGHDAEEFARKLLDAQGLDFYPVTCSEGKLSASCDGLTIDNSLAFEHKLYSDDLAEKVQSGVIPEYYMAQCQQVLMVTGADKLIFVCSDGTSANWAETEIFPDQSWFERIRSAWDQFSKDLETFEPKDFEDKPQAAAIMQLPALSVYTKGDIVVHGNLDAFKEASDKYIASINKDLKTDEDFVNAEAAIKRCKEVEQNIKTAKASIIGGIASVDEATRVLDYIDDSHAKIRLMLEKLVKSQKDSIKTKIIDDAFRLCSQHRRDINEEFNNIDITMMSAFLSRQSFEAACKGLRTLSSLHNAVDTEVAAIKIKLDELAGVIRRNLRHLPDDLSLFRDLQSIITKPEDDFKLLVEYRLDDQKRKEAQKRKDIEIAEAKAKEESEAAKLAAAQEQKKPDPEPLEVIPAVKRYAASAPVSRPVAQIIEKPFLVLMQKYEDLTDEEKEDAPSNGCGSEWASYIRVIHNGETQLLKNDAVEPEDATFSRDFNWVLSAIREAYELGVKDGKQLLI